MSFHTLFQYVPSTFHFCSEPLKRRPILLLLWWWWWRCCFRCFLSSSFFLGKQCSFLLILLLFVSFVVLVLGKPGRATKTFIGVTNAPLSLVTLGVEASEKLTVSPGITSRGQLRSMAGHCSQSTNPIGHQIERETVQQAEHLDPAEGSSQKDPIKGPKTENVTEKCLHATMLRLR